jgi:AraC-like DNA-binding protein
MQKASRLLETSHAGVAEIAKRVGYDAEAAFSKAFKRWIGVAPGAYRRTSEGRSHPKLRASSGGAQDFRGPFDRLVGHPLG